VFHQNKKGIRQISHAMRKKRSFWVRDIPGFARASVGTGIGLKDIGETFTKQAQSQMHQKLLYDIGIEHANLLQIMRHGILG